MVRILVADDNPAVRHYLRSLLEQQCQISGLFPEIPILMVTIHLSKQLADEARRAGIRGACAKSDVGSIVEAVDALLHAKTYFPASVSVEN